MELSDLFVSHKQVQPVSFYKDRPELPKPIYLNRERAQQAVSGEDSEVPEDDMSTWKVGDGETSDQSSWSVATLPGQSTTGKSVSVSWQNPYIDKRQQWITDMTQAYKKQGLSDNAIKNLIAKNALESGWGRSAQGSFNFGNITTGSKWTGDYVDGKDKDANGNPITNRFRAYNSLDDYVKDEIQFLTSLYDFKGDDDFDTFIGKLQGNNSGKRRYAADKEYASKVRGVYNSI